MADAKLGVFNTGMLTVDESVPFTESTFIVLNEESPGHLSLGRGIAKPILTYQVPNCPALFK